MFFNRRRCRYVQLQEIYFSFFQKDLMKELKVKEGLEKFMSTDTSASRKFIDETQNMLEVVPVIFHSSMRL